MVFACTFLRWELDKQLASFTVWLHIPLPPGDVRAQGLLGLWNYTLPGQTPLAGEYTFENADLGVFHGIAGTLSEQASLKAHCNISMRRGLSTFPTS
jgi:hypothetical protein